MFSEPSTILSSELGSPAPVASSGIPDAPSESPIKKIVVIIGVIILVVALVTGIIWAVKKLMAPKTETPAVIDTATTTIGQVPTTLPNLNGSDNASSTQETASSSLLAIEYLSFADFYKAPDNAIVPKLNDYQLPLNIKMDVMNYYDVSRKLSLDNVLDKINNNGFATIDNPWAKQATDFYAVYASLDDKQLPLMITSDFMIYYYQNIMKKTFKDVEENVFYDNLWDINKELYDTAKNRYETRLAAIGNVNDSILEGERLEMAYFAVALELMKPAPNQMPGVQTNSSTGVFSVTDVDRFYFVTPPYLKEDVLAEVNLIREAKLAVKSPVMLYSRDYKGFQVPFDYRTNAKLNNFYLTTAWLNSVFPLNYRSKDCQTCLIDVADWRNNMIAATFMAQDFSKLPGLKNKWARIYKVMSFFKGLRDDLNYVQYRDAMIALFGNDYVIEDIFADSNKEAAANLEKLRSKVAANKFSEISGGLSKSDPTLKPQLGFKLLAENYWPNNYIFSKLTYPSVGLFQGTSTKITNITACRTNTGQIRCNGVALDIVSLIYPVPTSNYLAENINYNGYSKALTGLQGELQPSIWHSNNYWANLSLVKSMLTINSSNLPLFARSAAWQDKSLITAAGAWINLQLPPDKFSVAPTVKSAGFENAVHWNENSYVEPNLNLVNELIANAAMMTEMFSALQLETEVRFALQDLRNFSTTMEAMKAIVLKELNGEELNSADNEAIAAFTKQFKTEAATASEKQLSIKLPNQKNPLKEDLSRLKLLLIVHQEGANKIFSVGPVWDYQESR